MPLVTTRASAFGLGWGASSPVEVLPMSLMVPSSVSYTGTSASIAGNGSVSFDACTRVSLDGIFNQYYTNYVMSITLRSATDFVNAYFRMRASGTDSTTAYYYQEWQANGSTTGAGASNTSWGEFGFPDDANRSGMMSFIGNPYETKYTVLNTRNASNALDAFLRDYGNVHQVASSYNGLSLISLSYPLTGTLNVYGFGG